MPSLHGSDTFSLITIFENVLSKKKKYGVLSAVITLSLTLKKVFQGGNMINTTGVGKRGLYDFWQGSVSPWLLWTWPAAVAKDLQAERSALPRSKPMNFSHLPQSIWAPASRRGLRFPLAFTTCQILSWVQCIHSPHSHNSPMRWALLFPLYM